MTMFLVSTAAVVVVLHVLSSSATLVQSTPSSRDFAAIPANYVRVTCNFSNSMCGWANVGGSNYPLTWKRDRSAAEMYLNMIGDQKGRLASPWLDPLDNYRCRLSFLYLLNRFWGHECQLRLIRQTASGQEKVIKVLDYNTGWLSDSTSEEVNCTGDRFRLVFEGWKRCGTVFGRPDTIKLDDIVMAFTYVEPTPQTGATSSKGPGTSSVTSDSSMTFLTLRSTGSVSSLSSLPSFSPRLTASPAVVTFSRMTTTDEDKGVNLTSDPSTKLAEKSSGLGSGSLAGIIIAGVLIIVVVVVVVVVTMILRRRRKKSNADALKENMPHATLNAAYSASSDDLHSTGNHGVNSRGYPSCVQSGVEEHELPYLPAPCSTPPHPSDSTNHSGDNHISRPHHPHPALIMNAPSDSNVYVNVEKPFCATSATTTSTTTTTTITTKNVTADTDAVYCLARDASSISIPKETYNHVNRNPSPEVNTYHHLQLESPGSISKHTYAKPTPLTANAYDHVSRKVLPASSENAYDHTSRHLQHSVTSENVEHNYNHLDLQSEPQYGATPLYENIQDYSIAEQHHPQSPCQDYAEPQDEQNRNPQPPISYHAFTSSEDAASIFAHAGTTDYESVDDANWKVTSPLPRANADDGRERVTSSIPAAETDDAYNLLDVRGEGRGEGIVAENFYDHAKNNNYDSLHEDKRKKRQQRHMAKDNYSHI